MSTLAEQMMTGDFPTPRLGDQIASDGWYEAPAGAPTLAEVNRAREALARMQMGSPGGFINVPMAERDGLAGKAGPGYRAVWVALNRAYSVARATNEDSSLDEWERLGCPVN